MIDSPRVEAIRSVEDLMEMNRKIVSLGEKYHKPVVATCDVHFIDPDDGVFRKIIMEFDLPMLKISRLCISVPRRRCWRNFNIWEMTRQKEVVITNTNLIAEQVRRKLSPFLMKPSRLKLKAQMMSLGGYAWTKLIPFMEFRLAAHCTGTFGNGVKLHYQ